MSSGCCEGENVAHVSRKSKLVSDIASSRRSCKNIMNFSRTPQKVLECVLESSIARNSIGNRSPVQKYVGAMVRWSIRVVLVAENDLIEVASDPDNFRFVTEVGQGGLPLYRTTEKRLPFFYTVYGGSHELENVAHVLL